MKRNAKRATGVAAGALAVCAALAFAPLSGATAADTTVVAPAPVTTTVTTTTYSGSPLWETHGRVLAMNTSDRIIVLDDGSVLRLDGVTVAPRDLDDRAMVYVTYQDREGELFVTHLLVEDREVQAP